MSEEFIYLGYIYLPAAETFVDWEYIEKHFTRSNDSLIELMNRKIIMRRDGNPLTLSEELNQPLKDEVFKQEMLWLTTILIKAVREKYTGDFMIAYGYRRGEWEWRIETAAMIMKE